MTVRTLMPLVFAGVGVEQDHSLITVPVSDVQFIGFGIHPHFGRSSKICDVVAAFARSSLANLHQELSVLGKLQDHAVMAAKPETGLAATSGPSCRKATFKAIRNRRGFARSGSRKYATTSQ
jgi:hypothetical protein